MVHIKKRGRVQIKMFKLGIVSWVNDTNGILSIQENFGSYENYEGKPGEVLTKKTRFRSFKIFTTQRIN